DTAAGANIPSRGMPAPDAGRKCDMIRWHSAVRALKKAAARPEKAIFQSIVAGRNPLPPRPVPQRPRNA
ncbi:hypothetical protein, partial [Achromobacter insuavis]|uniref:hypothetical protein n=1 Tax=Achromobacter insuavis TaxID=1287735 RepID=UPI001F12A934